MVKTEAADWVRQECLFALCELGEKEALARLVQEIDQHGLAVCTDGNGPALTRWVDWRWLKEVHDNYPLSYLARGITAYEQVRGEPYFVIERLQPDPEGWWPLYVPNYSDGQYNPAREIPGWEEFLAEFPESPLADGALLAMGAYTGEPAYLERILNEYPGGRMAERAGTLLEEMRSPYYRSPRLDEGP